MDIVDRLRSTRASMLGTEDEQHYLDCHEAADEIVRLRGSAMQIALKVTHHLGGYTLMQRTQSEMAYRDCREADLFGNVDAGSFYRAVAAKLNQLRLDGHNVIYEDVKYIANSPLDRMVRRLTPKNAGG